MSKWLIVLIVLAVWFVLMEISNRRQRPLFEKVERENAALLEGRFQSNPVLRRKFMRALVRHCCAPGFDRIAFAQAQSAARMARDPLDRAACALLMAFNLEDNDDYAEAIELYDSVLDAEPNNLIALSRKASALGMLREEDCVEVFEELIRRAPDNPVYRNNYGSALLRIRRFEDAEAQLKKAIELNADLPNPYELLTLAYSAMNDSEAAESALAEAVARGSNEQSLRQTCKTFLENLNEK